MRQTSIRVINASENLYISWLFYCIFASGGVFDLIGTSVITSPMFAKTPVLGSVAN